MIIFYNKATGDVVGSVDGFSTDPTRDNISVEIPGVDVGRIDVGIGHPQEAIARQVEDHFSPLQITHLRVENGEVRPLTEAEQAEKKAKKDKAKKDNEAWQKANPPRDLLAEIDDLKSKLDKLTKQNPKP